jgi:hypothetical protein
MIIDYNNEHPRHYSQEKKLLSLHDEFREHVLMVLVLLQEKWQPTIIYGYRSEKVQRDIYNRKRSSILFGFHNTVYKPTIPEPRSLAVDIIDRRQAWEGPRAMEFFKDLGQVANDLGLYWGGDWKKPDYAHVQLVGNEHLERVKKEGTYWL